MVLPLQNRAIHATHLFALQRSTREHPRYGRYLHTDTIFVLIPQPDDFGSDPMAWRRAVFTAEIFQKKVWIPDEEL